MLTCDSFAIAWRNLTPAGLTELDMMHRIASFTLNCKASARTWLRVLSFGLVLAGTPAFAADTPAPAGSSSAAGIAALNDAAPIVSKKPMEIEALEGGAHGQLPV